MFTKHLFLLNSICAPLFLCLPKRQYFLLVVLMYLALTISPTVLSPFTLKVDSLLVMYNFFLSVGKPACSINLYRPLLLVASLSVLPPECLVHGN